jgi:hypothetical protein
VGLQLDGSAGPPPSGRWRWPVGGRSVAGGELELRSPVTCSIC